MATTLNEKRHYLWPTLFVFTGLIVGATIGWLRGVHSLQSIADAYSQKGEFFCGTGIIFLPFFLAFVGAIAGTLPGLAAAVFVYFKTTPRTPRTQSEWAAYYGK
jgi:hypothetical protein